MAFFVIHSGRFGKRNFFPTVQKARDAVYRNKIWAQRPARPVSIRFQEVSNMRVVSVNVSEKKGTRKVSRPEVVLKTNWGVEGDSHADGSHRQLSLLGIEDIDYMRRMGADVKPGDFAENITTEGVELSTYPIGTHFRIGEGILLELTQIGKECHSGCEIRRLVGTCIMPKKGVFCRILKGGTVKPGDSFSVVEEKAAE